jgi:hypothetical protein
MSAPRIEITSLIDAYQLLMLSAGTLMLSNQKRSSCLYFIAIAFIITCVCIYVRM